MSMNNYPSELTGVLREIPNYPRVDDPISAKLEAIHSDLRQIKELLSPPKSVIITGVEVDRFLEKMGK